MGGLEDYLELVVADLVVFEMGVDPRGHCSLALLKRKGCFFAKHSSELLFELLAIFGDERANFLEVF